MNYRLEVEKKEDFSLILPKGTFLSDYALNPGGFPQFFHFSPDQAGEKIASLQNQPFPHRQALVEYLRDYHQNLDAPPETLRNIDSLNDPQTLVVMTGQQPGLLTGPMYTIYKTLSCLWEAERIERTFRRRCIPIFWIASEDHNLEEATSIFWPAPGASRSEGGSEGGGYSILSIRPRRGHFKQPVGLLPLDPEGKKLSAFMQKLGTLLSLTATTNITTTTCSLYSHEVEHIVQSTLQNTLTRSGTLGEWFSRLMLTFFGPCGLVLFEPNDARVKRLASPLWQKAVADPLALPKIVDRAGQELERCGYLRQLSSSSSSSPSSQSSQLSSSSSSSPSSQSSQSSLSSSSSHSSQSSLLSPSSSSPGRCPFFLYENQHSDRTTPERVASEQGAGERMEMEQVTGDRVTLDRVTMDRVTREGVMWDGRLFRTRNQDYSPAQLQELLQLQPERFSPNVYLRPVFSESLFPTLFYLAGPGEMGYFAQIKGVYEYFGLKMPIILPRFSATLRDARKSDSRLLQDAYPQERKLNIFYLLNLYGPDFVKAIQSLKIKDYFVHYQIKIKLES